MSTGKITPEGSTAQKWVADMKSGDPALVTAGKAAWASLPDAVKRGWQSNSDVMSVVDEFGLDVVPSAPREGARRRKSRRSTKKTKKAGRKGGKSKASRRR